MPRTRLLAGAILATLLVSSTAAATDFSKVVVFGDSLSDNGNLSLALAPGQQPPFRFTTNPGTVTIENVANGLQTPIAPSLVGGTDYAWGGAGVLSNSPGTPSSVPTLTGQVNAYLAAGAADSNALYSIWGGANDIFFHATAAGAGAASQQLIAANIAAAVAAAQAQGLPSSQVAAFTAQITPLVTAQVNAGVTAQTGIAASAFESPDQAQANVAAAAAQEVKLIGQLQAAGVKNILVFNLPNVGITPSGTAQGAAAAASLTGLSLIFNGQLNTGLSQLRTGIIPINTYGLLNEVVANPQSFGFSNVTTPACTGGDGSSIHCGPQGSGAPVTYPPGTDQTYLFADGVHPTTAAHAMLGQYVLSVIRAPEQISLLGEAPLAASAAQYRAIRNQMLVDQQGSDTRLFASAEYGRQTFNGTRGSPKTDSNNADLSIGADVHASEHVSVGVALGLGSHRADFAGGGGYKLQDISGLGYALYHAGGGYAGGFASFGQSNFSDINRRIALGTMIRNESGKADGSHLGGGVEGGWWFGFDSGLQTGPFARAEWQSIKVNGYSESGNDSTAMWFGRQQRDALIGTLGWRLQGHWQAGSLMLSPYAELAWNHDGKADPREVTAGSNSMAGSFALTGYVPDKTWASADLGLASQFSPSVTGWLSYSGHFSDQSQKDNSVNLGLKVAF
jgi:outer membrane lipase/esterase